MTKLELTLRDYFAIRILHGNLTGNLVCRGYTEEEKLLPAGDRMNIDRYLSNKELAQEAYSMADAMLTARGQDD